MIKSIYKTTKANTILNDDRLNAFPHDPGTALLGICPREMKAVIAALFTLAKKKKKQEQSRCPSSGEWSDDGYTHNVEYYSAVKGMNY